METIFVKFAMKDSIVLEVDVHLANQIASYAALN
jgi:hypothetical protein